MQDWDLDDDGIPETLRLGFATPRRWLEDGKVIQVERAPTAFGPVAFTLKSQLSKGEVLAELDLPTRNVPGKILFRVRVPEGWRVKSALVAGKDLAVDGQGTVDLSGLAGRQTMRFTVVK